MISSITPILTGIEQPDGYTVTDTYYESLGGTYTSTGNTQNGAPIYYNSTEDTYLALCNYMETYYAWAFKSTSPVAAVVNSDIMYASITAYKDVGNGTDFPTGLGPDAYPSAAWYDGSQGTAIDPNDGEITVTAGSGGSSVEAVRSASLLYGGGTTSRITGDTTEELRHSGLINE